MHFHLCSCGSKRHHCADDKPEVYFAALAASGEIILNNTSSNAEAFFMELMTRKFLDKIAFLNKCFKTPSVTPQFKKLRKSSKYLFSSVSVISTSSVKALKQDYCRVISYRITRGGDERSLKPAKITLFTMVL